MKSTIQPYQLKRYLPMFALMGIMGLGVLAATLLSFQSQDIRHKAAGLPDQIDLTFTSASSRLNVLQTSEINLEANIHNNYDVDGIQAVFEIDGHAEGVTITPRIQPDLEVIINTIELIPNTQNKRVSLVFITTDPQTPASLPAGIHQLATITLSPTSPGSAITFSYNEDQTHIVQNSTETELVSTTTSNTFTTNTAPTPIPTCDNGICEQYESTSCPQDCDTSTCQLDTNNLPVCPTINNSPTDFCSNGTIFTGTQDKCRCPVGDICLEGVLPADPADCGNNTCDTNETSESCPQDCDAVTIPICPDGTFSGECNDQGQRCNTYILETDDTCTIPTCSDGTSYGECSTTNPGQLCSSEGTLSIDSSCTSTNTTHTFQVKFVGVTKDVGPINAQLKWNTGAGTTPTSTHATFTHYQNGVYQASITHDDFSDINGIFNFSIKGEKHVGKVFLNQQLNPTHVFDFTSRPLQPGDLNNQDGEANYHDIAAIIEAFKKPTLTVDDLFTADLNYDGVVNSMDMGLILATLSTRPDETI